MANPVVQRRLQIIIDDSGADKALQRLKVQQDKLTQAIDKGKVAGKDMTTELTKLEQVKGKIVDLEKFTSGKLAPSFRQVQATVKNLRNELALMSRDAPGYAEKFARLKEVSATFDTMKGKVNGFRTAANSVFSQIKSVALGVTVGNTISGIAQSITGFVRNAVTNAAKLSDEMADIEKATGLSSTAVAGLNRELGRLNTRTATSELRQIAVALGQAGEAASSANVQALDRINVALGDEFGGDTREIGNTLSVLRNNLNDIKTGDYADDVTKIGNALNELGANGLATAPVVSDIANRIAGVARTFGVSSGAILGTAAAFQELGINVERGSTAYTKLLQKMASDTEAFAEVAGIPLKEFEKLLNEDINEALLKVAEGSKNAGASNTQFAAILNDLNAEGAGVSELLAKLATNSDLVRGKIDLATRSLRSQSSIMDEFSKKNNTLAANFDKLGKAITRTFEESFDVSFLNKTVTWLTDLFTSTNKTVEAFENQQAAFNQTISVIDPLYDRYLKLKNAGELNTEEQTELANIIQQIVTLVPSAAAAFDEYGNALDINTQKLGIWREDQKKFIQDLNRDAIDSLQEDIDDSLGRIGRMTTQMGQLNAKYNADQIRTYATNIATQKKLAIDAANELVVKYGVELPAATKAAIDAIRASIGMAPIATAKIDGGVLFRPEDTQGPGRPPTSGNKTTTSEATKRRAKVKTDAQRAAEEAKRDLEDLLKELQGIEREIFLNNLDPYERRLTQIANKYNELFTRAGKDIELRERILRDMLAETQQLNKDFQAELDKAEIIAPPPAEPAAATEPTYYIDLANIARERMAKLEREFLQAQGKDRLAARKAQLDEEERAEIEALKISANNKGLSTEKIQQQIFLIEEKYRGQRQDAELTFQDELFTNITNNLNFFLDGFTQVSSIIGMFESNRMAELEENYRREQDGLAQMLDNKVLTQAEYNRRISRMDRQLDRERAEIAKKEHRRNQIAGIAQAVIDGATGAVKVWANPGYPMAIPLTALIVANTAAQIVAISKSRPPTFAKGGILPQGSSHAQGGISLRDNNTGRQLGEIEGGEPIISKPVYQANRSVVDALLAKGHARDFNPITPAWYSNYTPINVGSLTSSFSRLPRYADGGILPSTPSGDGGGGMQIMNESLAVMRNLTNVLSRGISARVVYGDYEERANTLSAIRDSAAIG